MTHSLAVMVSRHWTKMTRELVHAAGRILTRVLLHPRWRHSKPMAWTYLRLYLLGKHITERQEVVAIRGLLAPGMVVADIGANVGFYTLQMASCVGPTGRVLAFEPDPLCFEWLQSRVRRSGATNVETHRLAIGDRAKDAILYTSGYNRADNRLHRSHDEPNVEQYDVQVRGLDSFVSPAGVPAFDAIKIDVQGAEEHVVRGAKNAIGGGLCWIWIEFSPEHLRGAGTDPRDFLTQLGSLNMDLFEIDRRGYFQPLADPEGFLQRIGSGYGDLVLMSASRCQRAGLKIPRSPD